ncbi:MAG: hydrogen gas-evolving membrane-bound hydrogenase subunit E [Nanoarchaeota archaeon]
MDKKKTVAVISLVIFAALLFQAIGLLPVFGNTNARSSASSFYINNALEGTGSANVVNSIVWDFRSYDTVGEETVLFAATVGVVLLVRRRKA